MKLRKQASERGGQERAWLLPLGGSPGSAPSVAVPAPPPPRLSRLRPLRGSPGSAPSMALPAPTPSVALLERLAQDS